MFFFKKRKAARLLPDNFTVTAHTGCMETPENSLASITSATEYGADTVEFDLHFNKNGDPVLSHDKPTGNEYSLNDAFAKISRCDSLGINIDVKNTEHLEKVVPLADKFGLLERIFFTGITDNDVEAVRQKCPDVPYYLNCEVEKSSDEDYITSLVNKVRDSGAIGINCRHKNVTKNLVDEFRRNGLLVSVWTVNRSNDMRNAIAFAPDNITTRDPEKLRKILSE